MSTAPCNPKIGISSWQQRSPHTHTHTHPPRPTKEKKQHLNTYSLQAQHHDFEEVCSVKDVSVPPLLLSKASTSSKLRISSRKFHFYHPFKPLACGQPKLPNRKPNRLPLSGVLIHLYLKLTRLPSLREVLRATEAEGVVLVGLLLDLPGSLQQNEEST